MESLNYVHDENKKLKRIKDRKPHIMCLDEKKIEIRQIHKTLNLGEERPSL